MANVQQALGLWRSCVLEVEAGYHFGIEDYLNDLDSREILDRAMAEGGDEVALRRNAVALLDERFVAATDDWPELQATLGSSAWWLRKPKRLSGELLEDARTIELR